VALFGYIQADDNPRGWTADATVDTPAGILDWIEQTRQAS